MSGTATYIYCLVQQARRPAMTKLPRGLPGISTPELIDVGTSLWGVAGEAPLAIYGPDRLEDRLRDFAWVADIAVAHESVVEHFAARRGATVVPMKLFTMFSSRERALADLKARRSEIAAVLARIRNCEEWGLRVSLRPAAGRGAAKKAVTTAASGTAFLAAKKQARDAVRQTVNDAAEAAETVYTTLADLSKVVRRREAPEGATSPPLVDAAFLVTAAKRPRFRAAARRLTTACRKAGADLTLTGPWPAYNFVRMDGESS